LCSYQPVTRNVTLATVTNCKFYFFEAPVLQKPKRLGLDRFIKKPPKLVFRKTLWPVVTRQAELHES
jgi:hypothetical protein